MRPNNSMVRHRTRLPIPRDTYVAVARSHYRVHAHKFEPWSFAWLEALEASGDDGRPGASRGRCVMGCQPSAARKARNL
jgi:hypothetical protein